MKRNRFKKFVFLPLSTSLCFFVITSSEKLFSGGCFETRYYYNGRMHYANYGDSRCPSHYSHGNINPKYEKYVPVPMTVEEASEKGWRDFSDNGYISSISKLEFNDRQVYFFCPTSSGGVRRNSRRYPETRDYAGFALHPRMCPPEQYPYKEIHPSNPASYHIVCSGTNKNKLEPTSPLRRDGYYYKAPDGTISSEKYYGLCPADTRPACRPSHGVGFQTIVFKSNGKEYPWTFKLDCEPVSSGGGGSDSNDNEDEDDKTCPTIKVKINGFPFQRIKVKAKRCS